jgi:hypothetical protein
MINVMAVNTPHTHTSHQNPSRKSPHTTLTQPTDTPTHNLTDHQLIRDHQSDNALVEMEEKIRPTHRERDHSNTSVQIC